MVLLKQFLILTCLLFPLCSLAEKILLIKDIKDIKDFKSYNDLQTNSDEGKSKFIVEDIIIDDKSIIIIGAGQNTCKLNFDDLIPAYLKPECHCGIDRSEEQKKKLEYIEMFKNAKNFRLFCFVSGDEVISFTFDGNSTLGGREMSIHSGNILNFSALPKPEGPKVPTDIEKLSKRIWKWFLKGI